MQRLCLAWAVMAMSPLTVHAQSWNRQPRVAAGPSARESVFHLTLPDGESQRVLYLAPMSPRATLVMLPGGSGDVGVEPRGDIRHDDNFVVRTRDQWVSLNYAVIIPDAAGHENLRGQRSSPAYARLIAALVDAAHKRSSGPVFLLGTSQGSIAAMNGAAHARAGSIAGVVLTESVSILGGSHETVFDADPGEVRVPALVVANDDDRCNVAPPQQAARIVAAMVQSADASLIRVQGGRQKSASPCGSLTPHGYYGIEATVIGDIASWLGKH
jgi:hypothetical protein